MRLAKSSHALLPIITALSFCVIMPRAAAADDAAERLRLLNLHVSDLITSSKFDEAESLAQNGLALCADAGAAAGVLCESQFNDSLGDIARARGRHSDALAFYDRVLRARVEALDPGDLLIARSELRMALTYVALKRDSEAEEAFRKAVAGFERQKPPGRALAIALSNLRAIYYKERRYEEAVAVGRRAVEVYTAIDSADARMVSIEKMSIAVALFERGMQFFREKDYDSAEKLFSESVFWVDPLPPGPEIDRARRTLRSSLAMLGGIYLRRGQYEDAEKFSFRALELAAEDDNDRPIILSNIAEFYLRRGNATKAISYANQAMVALDQKKDLGATRGHVLFALGRAQYDLGQYGEAEPALVRAIDIFNRTLPENDEARINAQITLGNLQSAEGKLTEAVRTLQTAIEMQERSGSTDTLQRSTVLASLAAVYRDLAQYPKAHQLASQAVALEESAGGKSKLAIRLTELASILRRENHYDDAERTLLRALSIEQSDINRAAALNLLGLLYNDTSLYAKADPLLREALNIRTRLLGSDSALALETLGNLATIDIAMGREADAETKLRNILSVLQLRDSKQATVALYSAWLAGLLISKGKIDEAESLIQRAIEINKQRLGPEHPRTAGSLKVLASLQRSRGRIREATSNINEAMAIHVKTIGPNSAEVAGDLLDLSSLLLAEGKWQDAKADIDQARAIVTAQFPEDSPMRVGALVASADFASRRGLYDQALQLTDQARQIREQAFGPNHPAIAVNLVTSARLEMIQGHMQAAESQLKRASEIVDLAKLAGHPINIDVLQGLADLSWQQGNRDNAERYLRQAFEIAANRFSLDQSARISAVDRLAGVMWAKGQRTGVEQVRRDLLTQAEKDLGPDHPGTATAIRGLAIVFENSARVDEALTLYRRALAIDDRAFGTESREAAGDHFKLGSALAKVGRYDEARGEINNARTRWERDGNSFGAILCLDQLAFLAALQGAPTESVVHLERMLSIREKEFGADSPALVAVLAQLGRFYVITGRIGDAKSTLARIRILTGEEPPELSPGYLEVLRLRAILSADDGDYTNAEVLFKRGIVFAVKQFGSTSSAVGGLQFNLALTYVRAQRYKDAIDQSANALSIYKKEIGDRAPIVGYTLLLATAAYIGLDDQATAKALAATAIEILGPTIAARRPEPRWQ